MTLVLCSTGMAGFTNDMGRMIMLLLLLVCAIQYHTYVLLYVLHTCMATGVGAMRRCAALRFYGVLFHDRRRLSLNSQLHRTGKAGKVSSYLYHNDSKPKPSAYWE